LAVEIGAGGAGWAVELVDLGIRAGSVKADVERIDRAEGEIAIHAPRQYVASIGEAGQQGVANALA